MKATQAKKIVRKINRTKYICNLFWDRALAYDNVNCVSTAIVVFSDNNPWVELSDRAHLLLQSLRHRLNEGFKS